MLEESVWIHAASLGEVNAIKPLVKKLIETYNKKTFLMTCVTKTGLAAAKEISGKLFVRLVPLDMPHIMKKSFKVFKPKLIILMETEIWPCMLRAAFENNVPVILVNARLSHSSFHRYNFFRWFLRKEFSTIKLICAQSVNNFERFRRLKFNNVMVSNNLKFSVCLPEYESHILRNAWNYQFNDFIIAIGSSRPGEEQLMKDLYYQLVHMIPKLKMIIVPRHLHRVPEIVAIFDKDEYALFSDSDRRKPFLIVDEIGVLPQIYALCDLALIGGSFYDFGGHNPLEAIWYEKAVIVGQYHQSCLETVEKFLSEKAIIVSNVDELVNTIHTLSKNVEHRINIGKKAKKILLENEDALCNHWNEILKWI